jgi:hypothetical protein
MPLQKSLGIAHIDNPVFNTILAAAVVVIIIANNTIPTELIV